MIDRPITTMCELGIEPASRCTAVTSTVQSISIFYWLIMIILILLSTITLFFYFSRYVQALTIWKKPVMHLGKLTVLDFVTYKCIFWGLRTNLWEYRRNSIKNGRIGSRPAKFDNVCVLGTITKLWRYFRPIRCRQRVAL